jgi:alanyl-tRNA synthetase
MEAHRIRQAYLEMLVENGHTIIPRTPLVLRDDPTTLFTGSGMQPLLRYLLGEPHPAGTRIGDVQPCLRAQDINDVGDNRHTTFFEMLGNWSLGDYSKSFQIPMLWRFLTDVVGLPPERIYVTCYIGDPQHGIARDDESAEIWTDLFRDAGISRERIDLDTEERGNEIGNKGARIAFYGAKNWWSRAGGAEEMPIGDPGGPDSEVFFYFPQVEHDTAFGRYPHQNSDGGQYLEIGNSVFMEFQRTVDGFVDLPRHNVDFGGGLERIAAGRHRQPRRLPHRSAVADRGGPAVVVGPLLRGFDRRDARGHRPHPGSRAARRGRGASGQQGPVLRHAQAGAPGAALRT